MKTINSQGSVERFPYERTDERGAHSVTSLEVMQLLWPDEGWQEYVEPPAEPVNPVPYAVTMRQARLALLQAGLLDAVTAAVQAVGGVAVIEWEYSNEVQRDNPLISTVAAQAGLTMEQINQLFMTAITL